MPWVLFLLSALVCRLAALAFYARFTGGPPARWQAFPGYGLLTLALAALAASVPALDAWGPLLEWLLLFGFGRLFFGRPAVLAALGSLVAVTVLCLCDGLTGTLVFALDRLLFPPLDPGWVGLLALCGSALTVPLACLTFRALLRFFRLDWGRAPSAALLLLPLSLVLLVTRLISRHIYGPTVELDGAGRVLSPLVNDWEMLLAYGLGYACLLAVLYGWKKVEDGWRSQTRLALLEQQTQAQGAYVREAESRYRQTQALRHDLQNHLLVLDGLLRAGEGEEARSYLSRLEETAGALSFPCKTGSTAVDVLLGSKLALARREGVETQCAFSLPSPCGVEELDLCVVLSNAVDNALKAVMALEPDDRYLRISARCQGDFLCLEVENTRRAGRYPKGSGLGLGNIRAVAEKYGGAVSAEETPGRYLLGVLLLRSPQSRDH